MTKHAAPPPEIAVAVRIDRAEIAWIVSKRGAAMRSRDADWLAARYLPDAPVLGPMPPVTRVADPARDAVALWHWFELLQGRIRWTVRIEAIRLDGDRAVCRAVEHVSFRVLRGRRERLDLETVIDLRRLDDRWMIASEMAVEPGGPRQAATPGTSSRL